MFNNRRQIIFKSNINCENGEFRFVFKLFDVNGACEFNDLLKANA